MVFCSDNFFLLLRCEAQTLSHLSPDQFARSQELLNVWVFQIFEGNTLLSDQVANFATSKPAKRLL